MTEPPGLIAIVDDDMPTLVAISSLLRSWGFRVSTFEDGSALLAELDDLSPSCVLSDIQMQGLSGLDLQVILQERCPEIAVVLMTAYPSSDVERKAASQGVRRLLTKPFGGEALREAIQQPAEAQALSLTALRPSFTSCKLKMAPNSAVPHRRP